MPLICGAPSSEAAHRALIPTASTMAPKIAYQITPRVVRVCKTDGDPINSIPIGLVTWTVLTNNPTKITTDADVNRRPGGGRPRRSQMSVTNGPLKISFHRETRSRRLRSASPNKGLSSRNVKYSNFPDSRCCSDFWGESGPTGVCL